MPDLVTAVIAGLIAGAVASAAMEAFQTYTASLFGVDKSDDDPSTVKAADRASQATAGHPVPKGHRQRAGRAVHYATGIALGVFYAVVAAYWLPITVGFGVAFGIAVTLLVDEILVPLLIQRTAPFSGPLNAHAYGLAAHVVYGAVLEGARRLVIALIA